MGCDIPGHQLWENLQSHTTFSATGMNLGLPHLHGLSLEMQKGICHEHFTLKEGQEHLPLSFTGVNLSFL